MPTETSPIALDTEQPSPRHHIDRRAEKVAAEIAEGGDTDQLLSTSELAQLLGVSAQFLEIGRIRRYGPEFVVSPRRIKYRRAAVVQWLRERTFRSTAEYEHHVTSGTRRKGDRVVDGRVVRADDSA